LRRRDRAARGKSVSVITRLSRRPEWWCIAAAVGVRFAAIRLASRSATPWIDPDDYLGRAAALSAHVPWLRALRGEDGQIVPPLYATALSIMTRAGLAPARVLIVQVALAGATCALVIALAACVTSRRAALAAGWGL